MGHVGTLGAVGASASCPASSLRCLAGAGLGAGSLLGLPGAGFAEGWAGGPLGAHGGAVSLDTSARDAGLALAGGFLAAGGLLAAGDLLAAGLAGLRLSLSLSAGLVAGWGLGGGS